MENTALSLLTGLAFLASSMTWARLSLSITVWGGTVRAGSGCGCGCCCALFLRRLRARSPSEGASSCAEAANGDSSAKISTPGATNRKLGDLDRMISVAERGVRAQRVHRESLGEMERKRSYRRDTMVLAPPAMGKGHGRAQIEATRNGARPCPFHQSLLTAGQRYENG